VDLALVLQRLYDSEINVTITWLAGPLKLVTLLMAGWRRGM
jgi:hypothetical protein